MYRGDIWWCDLPAPFGDRPVLVLQSDRLNKSAIETTIVAVISSDLKLLNSPDNVLIKSKNFLLEKDSVVKVSQILTVDKDTLYNKRGKLTHSLLQSVERGVARTLLL
ncbi:type II toxin-antitoxin system PemK/MazF family toxin [Candidatus Uabimicrobium helgolandensis]